MLHVIVSSLDDILDKSYSPKLISSYWDDIHKDFLDCETCGEYGDLGEFHRDFLMSPSMIMRYTTQFLQGSKYKQQQVARNVSTM